MVCLVVVGFFLFVLFFFSFFSKQFLTQSGLPWVMYQGRGIAELYTLCFAFGGRRKNIHHPELTSMR